MKWFGFHSLIIHNPVIPHGHILFIISIQVFNGSGVIGSFWQFCFFGSGYSSVHICQMNWGKKANHFIWYSREKENVIFWTNDSKRWIVNIWQSQEYYWVWAVLRRPNFITGHTWHLLSFLLKSKPNWGQADVRRKGKKVYITIYMILGEKKVRGKRIYFI